MQKMVLPIITAIVLIAAGFYFLNRSSSNPLEDLKYALISEKKLSHEDLKGKVTLVEFWATTCTTCVANMPDVIKYYEKYKPQGFDIMAVAMKYDDLGAIKNFVNEWKLPFNVAYDLDGSLAKTYGNVRFTPVMFLLDRNGEIVKSFVGKYNSEDFLKTLENTLKQQS